MAKGTRISKVFSGQFRPGLRRTFGRDRTAVFLILVVGLACACSGQSPAEESEAAAESSPQSSQDPTAGSQPTSAAAKTPEQIAEGLHKGIDVSEHAGEVDWREVLEAGHTFAFVKATEGVDLKDKLFDLHWQEMKEMGLVRGAYHFYVTEDDPNRQAEFFIRNVRLESGDMAPVADIELIGHKTQMEGLSGRLKVFLDRIEEHYGVRPIIYTSPNFWDKNMTDAFGDYPLWIAEYGTDQPRLPQGWSAWHLWQYAGDANVPGVEKSADLSHLNRDLPDRHKLLVP